MWTYEKTLSYPICAEKDEQAATLLAAPLEKLADFAMLCLALRYSAQKPCVKALLTDIFTECLNLTEVLSALMLALSGDQKTDVALKDGHIHCSMLDEQTAMHLVMLSALSLARAYDTALKGLHNPEAEVPLRFLRTRARVHYERLSEAQKAQ